MRRLLLVPCLMAIGLVSGLVAAEPLVLKESAGGSTIRVLPGQEFQVVLAPQLKGATTVTVAPLEAACVEALGREGGEAGQPYVFKYRASKVGTTPLTITFAEADAAAKPVRFSLTVKVRADAPEGGQVTTPSASPGTQPPEPPAKQAEAPAKAPETPTPVAPAEKAAKEPETVIPAKAPEKSTETPTPLKTAETPAKAPAIPPVKMPELPPVKPGELMTSKEPTIRFQFDGIAYPEVVRRFCQMTGKPLLGEVTIPGTLTFFDSEPYTYGEALDTLNTLLAMRSFMLVENGRFLQVIPLTDIMKQSLKLIHGADKTDELRPGEIVTVVLPLKYMDATSAVTAVQKMISTFGSLSPLTKGKGLVITDRVKTIQRVRDLLEQLDVEKMVEKQVKTCVLKHASAQAVAAVLTSVFGKGAAQPGYIRGPSGELVQTQGAGAQLTATADERSHTVVLMGSGDMIAQAEALIDKLDIEIATATGGIPGSPAAEIRIFALKSARAEDVANAVRQTLTPTAGTTGYDQFGRPIVAPPPATRIVADAATNRLIVAATLDQMPAIEKLIKDLDQATTDVGGTRIFRLKTADAQQLSQVIAMTVARRDPRARTGLPLSVTADSRLNVLIVSGTAGDIQMAATMIEELDKEEGAGGGEARDFHVVQIKTGNAAQLAPALVRLFTEQATAFGRPQAATKLRVEPMGEVMLVSAAPGDWAIITKILDELNKAAVIPGTEGGVQVTVGSATTRLVPLKYARASELAETLRQIYARPRTFFSSTTPPPGTPPLVPVVIAASDQTNSLLVSAGAEDQQAISTLIKALDVPVSEKASTVRIIRLKAADASKLAATLKGMMPPAAAGRAQPVLVEADPGTNSVLLRASEADEKMLEDIVSKLDEGTKQLARETRLFDLKHVSANGVAMMLRQLYPMTMTVSGSAVSVRTGSALSQAENVVIATAPGDRALIIEAPRATIEQIAQLIQTIDTPDSPTQAQIRTYALTNARATDLARSLGTLFAQQTRGSAGAAEPAPRFEADAATNNLLVSATAPQFEVIEGLIKKLEAVAVLAGQTKTFKLQFAKAPEVATVLQSMIGEGGSFAGSRSRAEVASTVRVASVTDSNTLVVQAPPDRMAMVEQLIKTLDTQEASPPSVIEIVQLKNAQAATLAPAVAKSLAEGPGGKSSARGGESGETVTVTPEPNSNSVLVRGPADKVKDAVAMIKHLDDGGTTAGVQVHVYPLKNGKAVDVAKMLGTLFLGMGRQTSSGRGADAVPPNVTADDRTNSLVVSASPAHFAMVEDILKTLDKADDTPDHDVQYVVLKNANASDVVDKLKSMFGERKGADKPVIEADSFGNAITIIAKDVDIKAMEPIIAKLDDVAKDNSIQVRVIPLSRVRAEKMAQVLQRLYGQVTGSELVVTEKLPGVEGDAPAPSDETPAPEPKAPASGRIILHAPKDMPPPPATPAKADDKAVAGAPAPRVTVAVDKASNSLIVSGTRQELVNLEALIDQLLPSGSSEEAEVRIYKIEKGDPVTVAKTLDELFNGRSNQAQGRMQAMMGMGGMPVGGGAGGGGRGGRGGGGGQGGGGAPAAAQPTVVFVPDVHTKSLLVRAKPMDFEAIEPLIKHLDQMSTVINELRVFSLKNTDATEVASNLNELFRPQVQPQQPAMNPAFPQQMLPQQGGRGGGAQFARAEQIRQMFEMQGMNGAAPTPVDASTMVKISANRVTNSVVVAAPGDAMDLIGRIIQELDQSAAPITIPVIKMYPLKTAEVSTTVRALQDLFPANQRGGVGGGAFGRGGMGMMSVSTASAFAAPVIVTGDEAGRLVIVSAPAEKQELIAKVVKEIDEAQGADALAIKIYKVQYADVTIVAQALTTTFTSATAAGGGGPRGPRAAGGGTSGLRITADSSTNSLVVRASTEEHEKIAKLLTELDVAPALQFAVQTIPLKNADATLVAASLNRVFASAGPAGAGGQGGGPGRGGRGLASVRQGDVVIEGDRNAKMLLVRADKEAFAKIQELVAKMDTATASTELAPAVIALKHAEATGVASTITQVFTPFRAGRGMVNPEDAVTAVGEPLSNSLIVTASPANMVKVQALIDKLDTETAGGLRTEMVVLKNAKAADLAAVLSRIVTTGSPGQGAQRGARGAPGLMGMAAPTPLNGTTVAGDPASNTLIISGPGTDVERLKDMAMQLDEGAGKFESAVVKLYPLKTAEVQPTVTALQAIFSQPGAGGGARAGARAGPAAAGTSDQPIVITGDDAARLIIVSAPVDKHELIAKIIKEMDQAQGADQVTMKVYKVQYADATSLATALTSTLSGATAGGAGGRSGPGVRGSGAVRISADASANTLLVRASAEEHEKIAKLLLEMDAPPSQQYTVQTITLKNADASFVAASLGRVFNAATTGGRGGGAAGTASRQQIVIEGDHDSRTLMVRADTQTFEKIQKLALQLDTASGAGQIAPSILPLKFAQATAVAAAVNQAFAPPRGTTVSPDNQVTAVAEPLSNGLIITASPSNMPKVMELVGKLDNESVAGLRREFMLLTKAKATDLATVLTKIYTSVRAGAVNQPPVVVAADAGSNALVMTGPSTDIEKLKQMAKDLDQATTPSVPGVYIIPLKNGDAVTVSAMVKDLYNQQVLAAAKAGRTVEPLAVSPDDRANAIVLATNEEMYKQVEEWVGKVEEMKPSRGTLRLITIQNADPTEVQNAINQLFGNQPGPGTGATTPRRPATPTSTTPAPRPRGAPGAPGPAGAAAPRNNRVETTVLPSQKAIMIDASDEDYEAIMKLVKTMEEAAVATKRQVQVFALKNATNTQVATSLTAMYAQVIRANATDQERVSIQALPQTRAVVVAAAKDKMDEIAHLIEQLDKEEIAPQLEFRIYPLVNATPTKILPALQQMLLQIKAAKPAETVNAQADERTRSIIVTARASVFEQIGKIIEDLDKPSPYAKSEVLVIKLKKGDATRMAAALNEMLRPSAAGQATPEALALQEQIRLIKVRSPGHEDLPELDLTKPIKISADPNLPNLQGANALMITSSPENLKAMEAIVELLDTVPLTEGVKVRLVHLVNADADSVTTILREIFTQGVRLAGKTGTSVAGKAEPDTLTGKALVNNFNVSADARTNSLVMSGLDESLALAELVVKDLDRDAGKIVTEVRLFKLKNADVARLLPVLQAVFAETPTTSPATIGAEGLRTQVTRLRTILDKEQGHATEVPKTRPALAIQADATTNILVVAARSDVMPLIADVINTMDIPGAFSMNTVRIYPLVNADATRMKPIIDQLYTVPAGAAATSQLRPEDKPIVAIDARTNALVVTSSDKTLAMIDSLLKRLDAKTPIDLRDVKLVILKVADAQTLAPLVQKMMDARVQRQTSLGIADAAALQVVVLADPRSNALMVSGSQESFDLIKSVADQLDNAGPGLSGQVQVFPLTHANAGAISTTLTNLFKQRYAAARTPDLARQAPAILPDLRTNALIVTATPDDTQILQTLLAKLDVEQQNLAVDLVVIPMKFNDAGIVGPTIQTLFQARLQSMTIQGQPPQPQDRVDVSIDSLTNSLIVSASKENLVLIRALLDKVDIEPPSETGIVRLYPLKNSDAGRVSSMLQSLVQQGLYKPGMLAAGNNPTLAAREKVAITVDVRTNVLIVSASKENFKVIEEIVDKIDGGEDFNALSDIRMYTLKRADATRLGPMLQTFFNAKRAGETAAGGAVKTLPAVIQTDTRTNTLLVAGSRETFASVEAMIQKLDGDQTLMGADFRVFFLKQAVATALQPTLQTLFTQRIERDTTKDPVTVVADPRTNAVIVGASPEDMALAENLINRLDAVPLPGSTLQVFPLTKSDAMQVANTLRNLYQAEGAAAAAAVGISVDTRLNAIVVSGGAADMQRIADLVRQLDTATVTEVTEIRIVSLKNADATELATLLTNSLNTVPKQIQAGGPVAQTLLQFATHTKDGQELVTSALQQGVLITPDRRSNSIVISAPIQNMPLLEALVESLDSTQPRVAEIRVITLVNADARQTATVLAQLFRAQSSGTAGAVGGTGAGALAVNYTLPATEGNGEKTAASATLGNAEQYALTITVDGRTNSLLIGGTQQYVELCQKVITELDSSPAQERQTQIYRLRNAQATDIETALRTFLDQERQRLVATLGADRVGAAQRLSEQDVAVVSEKVTNTLLVSASPRYFETVSKIIEELDQPPPQVLIQVLLVEITLDDTLDFGMDWNFTGTHTTGRSILTTPVTPGTPAPLTVDTATASPTATRQTVTNGGTGFGVAADIAKGGFSVAVTGGDFQYFLRALQSQGRLEVLSRPQILASDNQQATINVGQRVPFVTSSQINTSGNGGVFNTIQYQPVGIILTVTPRINADGFVRLVVAPEVSSISSSSVQISENVNASIINSRSATTTVTVQDGHTIIIGGLITSSNDERETKVPFFGDIPFLGYLFKTTEKVKNRTELLIILTPEVLRTVNQADKVTAHQTKQLTLPKSIQSDAFRDTTFDPERVRPEADNKGNNTGLQGAKTPSVPIPESLEGDEPGEVRPWVTVVPKPPTKGPAK